ncbi:hypothetical protein [Thermococcus gammatolerans]|uniref:Uncharacterized protein n=1 Tax=Thermococcus gammatolerans (strain DSM 15229 / JCM 11827 / EJ3) TaxID=593117 RepID=C5A4L3_THEGJ|nr:hypothetical protein [Thermococcus gammatolerans]ACS33175.1 Conserved hypothetical protein [Thermococcus gammatolerans EJ3]
MAKILGRLKVVCDDGTTISIAEDPLNRFFDEERIKELLRLQKKALEEWIEVNESFVKEVLEEEKKYGFDADRYPRDLIEKLKFVEGLDEEIASTKRELEAIKRLLKECDGCE